MLLLAWWAPCSAPTQSLPETLPYYLDPLSLLLILAEIPSSNHFSNALLSRSNVPSRGAIAKMKIDLRYTSNAQQNNFFALALRVIFGGGRLAKFTPYSTEVLL